MRQYTIAILIGLLFFFMGLYISYQLKIIAEKVSLINETLQEYYISIE